jgi:penicillin-binding protein 1C
LARAKRRQEWILDRMQAAGWLTAEDAWRAKAMPVRLRPPRRDFAAPHFVDLVLDQQRPQLEAHPGGAVTTTLDLAIQHHAEEVLRQQLAALDRSQVRHGAVVVLDVATGDVLALVGSGDFFSPDAGQVNGAWAPRSAGSTVKPFTYLLALERGANAATLLADVPTEFATPTGLFAPVNYDRRYRGPVRLREALASSLNVPAVRLLHELGGAPPLLDLLRTCGLSTLEQSAEFYGLGLTLGNAEVRLLELANAYACLARLGEFRPFRLLPAHEPTLTRPSGTLSRPTGEGWGEGPHTLSRPTGEGWGEGPHTLSRPTGEGWGEGSGTLDRVFTRDAAWLIADILSDNNARAPAFGLDSPLRFDFPAACKTGTSSDFRDNWAFAYTPEFVVGVWIGNFDATPMHQVSGVSGAAPVMHAILAHLHDRYGTTWYAPPQPLIELSVDRITGQRAASGDRNTISEKFLPPHLPTPAKPVDAEDQRLGRIRLPLEFARWLESPDNWLGARAVLATGDILESPVGAVSDATTLRIQRPLSGSVYVLDPDLPDRGAWLPLLAQAHGEVAWTCSTLHIEPRAGGTWVRLTEGRHVLVARDTTTGTTAETWIQVRPL